ncbi:MAG: XRE family transcriptional regulator [Lactobacillales bacterium]|jgi:phage repressor protein C with HTH and peptisase S24 domain|nr:XRE family transcriptional regulator [Lactobacillales bacterium]
MEKAMTYTGARIRELRKENGLTQNALAKAIGVTSSAIANYEKGFRTPKQDQMVKMAQLFNVSINALIFNGANSKIDELTGHFDKLSDARKDRVIHYAKEQLQEQDAVFADADELEDNENIIKVDFKDTAITMKSVPFYGTVSAGLGIWLQEEYAETISLPSNSVPSSDYDFALMINGDSMEPIYKDGEYIFLKNDTSFTLNAIRVVTLNGEGYFKKIVHIDNQLYLRSLNADYDDIPITEHDDFRIVGRIVN